MKIKYLPRFLLLLVAAMALQGCTTLADARMAKGTGLKQTYDASVSQTWQAAVRTLNALGLSIAAENKAEGYILAQRGMTPFSYGENISVFIKKTGKHETTVEVVSKKVIETNIFAPDWTEDIFTGITQNLKSSP